MFGRVNRDLKWKAFQSGLAATNEVAINAQGPLLTQPWPGSRLLPWMSEK